MAAGILSELICQAQRHLADAQCHDCASRRGQLYLGLGQRWYCPQEHDRSSSSALAAGLPDTRHRRPTQRSSQPSRSASSGVDSTAPLRTTAGENASNAYGFYIDYIDGLAAPIWRPCTLGRGAQGVPFAGFCQTRERVLEACTAFYGTSEQSLDRQFRSTGVRSLSFTSSADGRSAFGAGAPLATCHGKEQRWRACAGHVYTDCRRGAREFQIWRLLSVTIDEFYSGRLQLDRRMGRVKARPANALEPG